MLYNGSDVIRDVEWVIFDEIHYINDADVSSDDKVFSAMFGTIITHFVKFSSCYLRSIFGPSYLFPVFRGLSSLGRDINGEK